MFLKRKSIVIVALLLCVCTVCFIVPEENRLSYNASTDFTSAPQIILDAGHGGFDGGAVAQDGTVEKDINLSISLYLSEMLRSSGYEVILTRSTDTATDSDSADKIASRKKSDLKNRLRLMEEFTEAVFVSIHLNKFTTSAAKGSQIFYSPNKESSKQLSDCIQNSIVGLLQPENTRVNKKATSSTYLLHNAKSTAVLVECGFLSNKTELELLKQTDYQKKMAFCIYCGINNFFSKEKEI